MTSVTVNIETYSDADFTLVQDSTIPLLDNPLHMHVRTSADDATVWLEATTANGMITVVGDTVTLLIPESKLLNLPPGIYVHSLIMSSLSASLRTEIWRGILTHNSGPTRWAAGTP